MEKKDKIFLYITLLLALGLIVKSVFLDEVRNLNLEELKVKQFVEKAVNEQYNGFLKKNNIVKYKVVSIKKLSDEGKSRISYYDTEKGQYVESEIQGKYQGKVRGYFLHIIPYKEFKVATQNE